MRADDLERRLRKPHPLEAEYAAAGPRSRRRVRLGSTSSSALGGSIALLVLAIVAVGIGTRLGQSASGAGPESTATNPAVEPTKPIASFATDTPLPVTAAPCAAGNVRATVVGSGGAMGTQYVLIRLESVSAACSLPLSPAVAISDAAGLTLAQAAPADPNHRIDLAAALEARVGISSLCASNAAKGLNVILSFDQGFTMKVPVPAGLSVPCNGTENTVFVDELFMAP